MGRLFLPYVIRYCEVLFREESLRPTPRSLFHLDRTLSLGPSEGLPPL